MSERWDKIVKDMRAKQQFRAEQSSIIVNALRRFNIARNTVTPIRSFTRDEEIKPRNIALSSRNLNRRGVVFNF